MGPFDCKTFPESILQSLLVVSHRCYALFCHSRCSFSLPYFVAMSALIAVALSTSLPPNWVSSRLAIQFCLGDSLRREGDVAACVFEMLTLNDRESPWGLVANVANAYNRVV